MEVQNQIGACEHGRRASDPTDIDRVVNYNCGETFAGRGGDHIRWINSIVQ